LQENKIPIFEREGWQSQPSLSKIGILLIRRSLILCHACHASVAAKAAIKATPMFFPELTRTGVEIQWEISFTSNMTTQTVGYGIFNIHYR